MSLNPATGQPLARVLGAGQADYERVIQSSTAAFAKWRLVPPPQRGEDGAADRQCAARAQERLGNAGHAGSGQDQERGVGRSAGNDRHVRLRRRPVAATVWPDHRQRTPRPSHVRAVASARPGRLHHGLQFSGSRLGLERSPGPGLRRSGRLEAFASNAADRHRGAAHCQQGFGAGRAGRRAESGGRRSRHRPADGGR